SPAQSELSLVRRSRPTPPFADLAIHGRRCGDRRRRRLCSRANRQAGRRHRHDALDDAQLLHEHLVPSPVHGHPYRHALRPALLRLGPSSARGWPAPHTDTMTHQRPFATSAVTEPSAPAPNVEVVLGIDHVNVAARDPVQLAGALQKVLGLTAAWSHDTPFVTIGLAAGP